MCPQLVVETKYIDTLIKLLLYFTLLYFTVPIKVFSRFLAMFEVDFWRIQAWGKQTREMETALSKRDRS